MQAIDTGNTGFMLLCSSLVMLMTPGLAFFYGGLVSRRNVLTIMMQSFVSMGWTTVLWFVFGYSLCFSGDVGGIIGNLDLAFLRGITLDTPSPTPGIPLLGSRRLSDDVRHHHAGADHRRLCQSRALQGLYGLSDALAVLRLLPLRAHDLGRRHPSSNGAFSTSPAASSCTTSPASRRWPRSSTSADGRSSTPARTAFPLVALGTGLLWFGWYGFNAGSEFRVDSVTAVAFLNTDLAASFAAMTWLAIGWRLEKRPTFVGLLTGAVAGLATITPAAGYVSPLSRRDHRNRRRRRLLLRRRAEEPAALGRRARCLGRPRRWRRSRHRAARRLRRRPRSIPPAPTA